MSCTTRPLLRRKSCVSSCGFMVPSHSMSKLMPEGLSASTIRKRLSPSRISIDNGIFIRDVIEADVDPLGPSWVAGIDVIHGGWQLVTQEFVPGGEHCVSSI